MFKNAILANFLVFASCAMGHEIVIPDRPCLEPDHEYEFRLCKPFPYFVDGVYHEVPKNFYTDLASIPRILWPIYSPSRTETIPAAVIHDYIYECPNGTSRKEADSIFYDVLVYDGFSKYTAYKYWLAVRLFGKEHYSDGAFCFAFTDKNQQKD